MKTIYTILISIIFSGLVGGCTSLNNRIHGLDSMDEAFALGKQAFSTGNWMTLDQHTDYSGLTKQEIEKFRTRLAKTKGRATGEICIWGQTEYEALVSKGQLAHWNWNTPPEKVMLIKEMDTDPNSFVGIIFGVVQRDGKWIFCRAY